MVSGSWLIAQGSPAAALGPPPPPNHSPLIIDSFMNYPIIYYRYYACSDAYFVVFFAIFVIICLDAVREVLKSSECPSARMLGKHGAGGAEVFYVSEQEGGI